MVEFVGGLRVFGRIKGMFKASEACVIVKQAFRALPLPMLPFDPDALATRLVAMTAASSPDVYSGRAGVLPHPLATASIALAAGLHEEYEFNTSARRCVLLALGTVLAEADRTSQKFSPVDWKLLTIARDAHQEFADHAASQRSEVPT